MEYFVGGTIRLLTLNALAAPELFGELLIIGNVKGQAGSPQFLRGLRAHGQVEQLAQPGQPLFGVLQLLRQWHAEKPVAGERVMDVVNVKSPSSQAEEYGVALLFLLQSAFFLQSVADCGNTLNADCPLCLRYLR